MQIPTEWREKLEKIWASAKDNWLRLDQGWRLALTLLWWSGVMLLCLTMCVGCAGQVPAAPTTYQCRVPTQGLQKTPVPTMKDTTNGELSLTEQELRSALLLCNADKARTLKWIEERQ